MLPLPNELALMIPYGTTMFGPSTLDPCVHIVTIISSRWSGISSSRIKSMKQRRSHMNASFGLGNPSKVKHNSHNSSESVQKNPHLRNKSTLVLF